MIEHNKNIISKGDIIFGPVPSRRLGRSLGINNIPPKFCSYACIYCQLGNTDLMTMHRSEFFSPIEIYEDVATKLFQLKHLGEHVDYLTFVPDGEPTLDKNLKETILLLKHLNVKIAVITNSSLLWDKNVREALSPADWVSVKVDSVYQDIWKKINRPHGNLNIDLILEGIRQFADEYKGLLNTETMLVKGVNDSIESLNKTAQFIESLNASNSYILVPTRPPAVSSVHPPPEESLNLAFQLFSGYLKNVEFIISNEGVDFTFSENSESELLGILSVHPMRYDAIEAFLNKSGSSWDLVDRLLYENKIIMTEYTGEKYLLKKFRRL